MRDTESPNAHRVVPTSAPASPVIDRAHLGRMTLGDRNLEAEVLSLFVRQADLLLARMQDAPPSAIAAFAHTLGGSARGIGVWEVASVAATVELAVRGNAEVTVSAAVARLVAAVAVAQAEIAELLAAR
jgi:HPt (histidine-containing phosphotransfer) domain-containing protein